MRATPYALSLALVLLLPPLALAQKEKEQGKEHPRLAEIHAANAEAVAAFESYSFKKARSRLDRALEIAGEAKLTRNPALAETYVLMGVAHVAGGSDLYRGLHYFVRALRLDAKASIPRKLTTPQLIALFKTAQKTVQTVGQPPKIGLERERRDEDDAAEGPKSGTGLVHSPIDTARRGFPIPVKASAGLDIQAHRLLLYYRPAGTVQFNRIPMQRSKGVFRASIPPEAAQGRYVHYYIEALDQRGRLAGSMGSARSPNVVIIN